MSARGLRRDVGRIGELARGQRAPVEQRAQDIGPGRIADERRNRGHVENFAHASEYSPCGAKRHAATVRRSPNRQRISRKSGYRFSERDMRQRKKPERIPILSNRDAFWPKFGGGRNVFAPAQGSVGSSFKEEPHMPGFDVFLPPQPYARWHASRGAGDQAPPPLPAGLRLVAQWI